MAIFPMKFTTIRKGKLPDDIQLRFLKQLNRLLENGYTLIHALEVINWDKQLKTPVRTISSRLKEGASLDEALEHAEFHASICTYLYFTRMNGDITSSLKKAMEIFDHRVRYTKKFRQIIRYPLFLLIIFGVLLYFIQQFVLPSFADIFKSSTQAAGTVNFSLLLIDILSGFALVMLLLLGVILLVWLRTKNNLLIEQQIKIYYKIPVYRSFLKLQTSFLFAIHFSTLLKTGMSYNQILSHMAHQKKLPIIAHYAQLLKEELTRGLPVASLLSQMSLMENQLTAIFQKDVDITALEKDLTVYADMVTEEMERKTIRMLTFIQPVFFVVLASFIIFIYVTLMWPMFQLIQNI
ncbi:competence type IV pilus assembly protein ComGB [Lentibacillus sediminis]|uniref:competence type IV pilus assembly protein ComGB n=1 Tax=Lentibacillus sediminis TaxID=1940529 RepID=UPI000C1BAB36|nr:competence type IV pilus assembly protein ComGB [Lentibacillus sediminis]